MDTLLPGTQVKARGLTWEIVTIEAAGEQQRYRLRCQEGALRGIEFDLLSPFETIEPIVQELDPQRAGRLASWRLFHQAFLLEQALGSSALVVVQPGRLQLQAYQLVPVMRALQMSRPRLLLADGVGLGKTIEAGLVQAELIARRRAHRILIVSPAGPLLEQWRKEMRSRFGLRFEVVKDSAKLQELQRAGELGANPFDLVALCLTSIDFAKQEKVLQHLERTTYDLVIIDEAHHCARLGAAGDREDTQRRRLAEVLAQRSDGLLLLTATPHDGYDQHFASLMELLDPSLVDGRGLLRGEAYRRHVVRRLKRHVQRPGSGAPLFPDRKVLPAPVVFTPASLPRFAAFQTALLALVAPRLKRALKTKHYADVLAFIALLKRSVSTVAACRNTLQVVAERYAALQAQGGEDQDERRQRLRALQDCRRRLERYGALSYEEEQEHAALEAEDIAAELITEGADELLARMEQLRLDLRVGGAQLKRVGGLLEGLQALVRLAETALPEDPKLARLLEELRALRAVEPDANVLVYTEYSDSQEAVLGYLRQALEEGRLAGEILTISGQDPEKTREQVTERFAAEDRLVLLSTDATAEGLNLQARCHHLIHLELPYNPNRLEQRNGRIDRFGQQLRPIVRYLYLAGTFEERVLLRLVAKFERQRARLTFVPNTLGVLAEDDSKPTLRLLEGLAEEDGLLFTRPAKELIFGEPETEDPSLPAYRELLDEVEKAVAGFDRAAKQHAWLGEAGLNAEQQLTNQAEQARRLGHQLGEVDLLEFVCAAVTGEGGEVRTLDRDLKELRLSSSWVHGLDDLPGYQPSAQLVRISNRADRFLDDQQQPVAFLGRAHPLVQRAIDRVRNQQYGSDAALLDRRVSAARSPSPEPELLATFLGSVDHENGRAFERVLAVQIGRDGAPRVVPEVTAWQALALPERAVATAGVWERHFASWAPSRQPEARSAAEAAFGTAAEEFLRQHRAELERERESLDAWLRTRADEICGLPTQQQATLFDLSTGGAGPAFWRFRTDPKERLASFATDGTNHPAHRSEAKGVLSLHAGRIAELERREHVRPPAVTPLGLLMLVPALGGR